MGFAGRKRRIDVIPGVSSVLKDSLGGTYRKVILLQMALAVVVSLIGGVAWGASVAASLFAGAATVTVGSFVYAFLARQSRVSAVSGGRVLSRHVFAEVAKLLVALGLLYAAFASGWFVPWALLAGMTIAVLGHGIAAAAVR